MRLLTHNLLMCNRKQCSGGFPLRIVSRDTKLSESEFNPVHIRSMLSRIEYSALVEAASSLGMASLPPNYSPSDLEDDMFLKAVHEVIMDFHIEEGDLICPKCERKFPVTKGIPNMLLHDDEVMDEPDFECEICGARFRKLKHLRYHEDSVHCSTRAYTCTQCINSYKRSTHLRRHMQNAHSEGTSWACPWEGCEKKFKGPEQLRKHLKRHEKTYGCDLCGKSFQKKKQLEAHKERIHGPFACVHCDAIFECRREFLLHSRLSHFSPNSCSYCTESFDNSSSLKDHIATAHPYFSCSLCDTRFSRERDLRAHLMEKHVDAPGELHACVRCGLTFSKLANLNKHIRTVHEQSKEFECETCFKKFGHKHVLNRHMHTVHKSRMERIQDQTVSEPTPPETLIVTPSRQRVLTVLV